MSFAEFTYPLLQSWDWWHMYQTKGIQVQIGGSDQFGNIVAGIDAIKYIVKNHQDPDIRQDREDRQLTPYGFTVPLLTTASGEKFGKSAGNAIWLDKDMTSSFELYQVSFKHNQLELISYNTHYFATVLSTFRGCRCRALPQTLYLHSTPTH